MERSENKDNLFYHGLMPLPYSCKEEWPLLDKGRKSQGKESFKNGDIPHQKLKIEESYLQGYCGKAVFLSAAATLLIGLPTFLGSNVSFNYSKTSILTILLVHFLTLIMPLIHILKNYNTHTDLLHPSLVAGLTFIIFHLLFNLSVINDPRILAIRRTNRLLRQDPTGIILHSYAVLFIAWCAYWMGHSLISVKGIKDKRDDYLLSTPMYFLFGVTYIVIGILGNIGTLGGFSRYLTKMLYFYERWTVYERAMVHGGIKWRIFMRFLPVGLIVFAYGLYLKRNGSKKMLILLLLFVSLINVFFSCATGGRGTSLMVLFYSVILINVSIKKLAIRHLILICICIILISFVLGGLRSTRYYRTNATIGLMLTSSNKWDRFTALYLSNYLGTLDLVTEVKRSGTTNGYTAFAGLLGLFGGPTPVTTQAEIWKRRTGSYKGSNARYGPPGELFFNFGWIGVIIGMAFIGGLIKFFALIYDNSSQNQTLRDGMLSIYSVFTSHFIIIGNLSYLPPYFTYYSSPFYFIFLLLRNNRC